jgi:hypothetical protein
MAQVIRTRQYTRVFSRRICWCLLAHAVRTLQYIKVLDNRTCWVFLGNYPTDVQTQEAALYHNSRLGIQHRPRVVVHLHYDVAMECS